MLQKRLGFLVLCAFLSVSLFSQEKFVTKFNPNTPIVPIIFPDSANQSTIPKREVFGLSNSKQILLIDEDDLSFRKAKAILKSTSTSSNSSGSLPWGSGAVDNMVDKYMLKPTPGDLNTGAPTYNEDLHNGKINISIPLGEFKYFDYKIPVSINNRYPQVIGEAHGEPTFYVDSNVGGDWSLSVNSYKVSRRINGIPDEDPAKGYFSSLSQNKVNNPSSISDSDAKNGLKGNWDPAIDIFHYATPTVSGSFLLNISNGSYEILSGNKVHIEFTITDDELRQFVITDNGGIKYYFGGDSGTIEVSQSITDVASFGLYRNADEYPASIKFIIETVDGIPTDEFIFQDHANAFPAFNNIATGPFIPPSAGEIYANIIQNNSIAGYEASMVHIDSRTVSEVGQPTIYKKYWAILGNIVTYNPLILGSIHYNDPEMKREKVNTGWYLKQIELTNKKKINFFYEPNLWFAYRTYNSNKIQLKKIVSGQDFDYNIDNIAFYNGFPPQLEIGKFPINETHTVTTNFVFKPRLTLIKDEDNYASINIVSDRNNPRPYIRKPDLFSNAPTETLNYNAYSDIYGLLKSVSISNGGEETYVYFKNHTSFFLIDGDSFPENDRSFLDEIVIDGRKKFTFDYDESRLMKIHYPTGGTKEFSYEDNVYAWLDFNINLLTGQVGGISEIKLSDPKVNEIITTSEDNITIEKFVFETPRSQAGRYSNRKLYRPGTSTSISYAGVLSTSPMFNSHSTKNGVSYQKASKYINDELQFTSEFSFSDPVTNILRKTNEAIVDSNIFRNPYTWEDEKQGLLLNNKIYKTKEDGSTEVVKETTFSRIHNTSTNSYPNVYLANLEAGPYQNTSGAVQMVYSTYYYPYGYDMTKETRVGKDYFNSYTYSQEQQITEFKKTKIPSLGLNCFRPFKITNINNEGNTVVTNLYSPVEILGLYSTNSNVTVNNNILNNLVSNNRIPNLETAYTNNGKLVGATSAEMKFTPANSSGNGFVVTSKEKRLEIDNTNLSITGFSKQHINSGNPNVLIFDPKLKDQVEYDKYDETGRVLEYHSLENGMYTSIIWGYKKQFPVAIIENARYTEVENYVDDIQYYSSQNAALNQTLKGKLDNLRANLSNAQVTTYVYDGDKPIIITDPRGKNSYYEYNDFKELETIRDNDGHILEKYAYNFKTLSNYTLNFTASSVNWLNPTNYIQVGNSLMCQVVPSGGSGDYTITWSYKRDNNVLLNGSGEFAVVQLADANYAGNITLEYQITDNNTGITITRSRNFYVNQFAEGSYTLSFNNISEDVLSPYGYVSSATVTSAQSDTLRFWVFNMTSYPDGEAVVNINGSIHHIAPYATKVIEVPVQAGQTITCTITGTHPNYVILDILNPMYATANPTNPSQLTLSGN